MDQKENKFDAFICYAQEDQDIAVRIYNDLSKHGFRLWIDIENLIPGDKWKDKIHNAIEKSSYCIVLLSLNSVSKKGYIQKEIKIALETFDQYPPNEQYILPIRLDKCEPTHRSLKELHWINLFESYIKTINKIIDILRPEEKLKILHLMFGEKTFGGIETYVEGIRKYSKHLHMKKSILLSDESYPADYRIFKYASEAAIRDLNRTRKNRKQVGNIFNDTVEFINTLPLKKTDEIIFEKIKRDMETTILKFGDFNIVHSHFLLPASLSQKGYPTLFTSHSLMSRDCSEEKNTKDYNDCNKDEKEVYKNIKNLITMSKHHGNEVKNIGALNPYLMKPIFDMEKFENPLIRDLSSYEARRLVNIPEKFTILFLGRPVIRKGLDIIIEALNSLKNFLIQFVIIGRGFEYDKSTNIISYKSGEIKIPIDKNISCLILKSQNIPLCYKASDIVVCPSLYEPFGYVNLEAMISKRVILSSDIGGINEYVQNGKTGILFEKGNIDDLKEKINFLYNNNELRKRLSENAYDYIKNELNAIDSIIELDLFYSNIYKEYLNSH